MTNYADIGKRLLYVTLCKKSHCKLRDIRNDAQHIYLMTAWTVCFDCGNTFNLTFPREKYLVFKVFNLNETIWFLFLPSVHVLGEMSY